MNSSSYTILSLSLFLFILFFCFGSNVLVSSSFPSGDLTKAMAMPVAGEMPIPPSLDLARVGLGAFPKAPLPAAAGPSARGPTSGEG